MKHTSKRLSEKGKCSICFITLACPVLCLSVVLLYVFSEPWTDSDLWRSETNSDRVIHKLNDLLKTDIDIRFYCLHTSAIFAAILSLMSMVVGFMAMCGKYNSTKGKIMSVIFILTGVFGTTASSIFLKKYNETPSSEYYWITWEFLLFSVSSSVISAACLVMTIISCCTHRLPYTILPQEDSY